MKRETARLKDKLPLKGRFTVYVTRGMPRLIPGTRIETVPGPFGPVQAPKNLYRSCAIDLSQVRLISKQEINNIIVDLGKDEVIQSLTTGFVHPIVRMAIGDRGTIPSDQTVPKVPTADKTTLYNEVYRDDVDATVLNIGTPTAHEAQFIKAFSSLVIPLTSFSNQANPIVNEVGLVTANLNLTPLPRSAIAAPATPLADEVLFAMRTFNSVPFQAANEIAVTVRYTIFIE